MEYSLAAFERRYLEMKTSMDNGRYLNPYDVEDELITLLNDSGIDATEPGSKECMEYETCESRVYNLVNGFFNM